MQSTHKIVIPYLSFANEKIDVPVGLSELLESTWTRKEEVSVSKVVDKFSRVIYKKPDGRWATKFERRK